MIENQNLLRSHEKLFSVNFTSSPPYLTCYFSKKMSLCSNFFFFFVFFVFVPEWCSYPTQTKILLSLKLWICAFFATFGTDLFAFSWGQKERGGRDPRFSKKIGEETYLGENCDLEFSKLPSWTLSNSSWFFLSLSVCIRIYNFNKAFPFHWS